MDKGTIRGLIGAKIFRLQVGINGPPESLLQGRYPILGTIEDGLPKADGYGKDLLAFAVSPISEDTGQ